MELDSLSGIEETIVLKDEKGDIYPFVFDLSKNFISIKEDVIPATDSLTLCYRTFSVRFDKPIARRTLLQNYDSTARFKDNRVIQNEVLDI